MATMKGKRVLVSLYVDPVKYEALKKLSAATNRPMTEHIREAVDKMLAEYGVRIPKPRIK